MRWCATASARARLRLSLYRVDGEVTTIDIGLTMPTRDPAHVARLIDLKLERIDETVEAGFGFEALGLAVTVVEPMEPHADRPCSRCRRPRRGTLAPRWSIAFSSGSVRAACGSSSRSQAICPERAETLRCRGCRDAAWPAPDEARPRPLFLLPQRGAGRRASRSFRKGRRSASAGAA